MEKNHQEKFIQQYGAYYFKDSMSDSKEKRESKDNYKIGRFKRIDEEVENHIITKMEEGRDIDKQFIAWKAGRLKDVKEEGDTKNGFGKKIESLDNYLSKINKDDELKQLIADKKVRLAFEKLVKLKFDMKVSNLGTVYIFAIIYYLSKGKCPIYDKYAHTAVKALFFNKSPKDVFVGEAPALLVQNLSDASISRLIDSAMGLYEEYCWYLKEVFGDYSIDRDMDQALWVYGHSKEKFNDYNGNVKNVSIYT